jgi:hypothetical protein
VDEKVYIAAPLQTIEARKQTIDTGANYRIHWSYRKSLQQGFTMPKVTSGKRTPLQERLLATICLLDLTVGQGTFFRAEAINRVMGGRWTEHRQKQIDELVKVGALKTVKYHRYFTETFYALSKSTRDTLSIEYDVKERDYVTPEYAAMREPIRGKSGFEFVENGAS